MPISKQQNNNHFRMCLNKILINKFTVFSLYSLIIIIMCNLSTKIVLSFNNMLYIMIYKEKLNLNRTFLRVYYYTNMFGHYYKKICRFD